MHDSKLVRKDLGTAPVSGGGLDTEEVVAGGALRLRGRGGGMVGKPLYMCVSSASVGIGVVRALEGNSHVTRPSEDSRGKELT
jgi:hypothetical protein